jgi:hypothetical protein
VTRHHPLLAGRLALHVDGLGQALADLLAAATRRRTLQGPALSRDERRAVELVLTAALAWTVPVTSGSVRGSDLCSEIDSADSDLGRFTWLDTREAATKARTSTRAIVAAIARGALEARRRGRGRVVWEVTEESVKAYVSRRNNTD